MTLRPMLYTLVDRCTTQLGHYEFQIQLSYPAIIRRDESMVQDVVGAPSHISCRRCMASCC